MKIIELYVAEFGCMKDRKFTLDSGLNVIFGSNESGKSTLMLFIKFMLYGLPGRRSADRERALSRDGRRAAGTMLAEHGGKRYLVERRATASARGETVKVTDLGTGETLGSEPWEILVGVPLEAYESSCCISQMKASEISRAGAASAIDNMLASADESVDAERVLSRLDAVRKEYKLNRGEGGILFDTALEISKLREKQKDATDKHLRLNDISEKLARSEDRLEELTRGCEKSERVLRELRYVELLRRFDKLDGLRAERETVKSELSELDNETGVDGFMPDEAHVAAVKGAYLAYREAQKKAETRREQYSALPEPSEEYKNYVHVGERIEEKGGIDASLSEIRTCDRAAKSKKRTGAVLAAVGGALALVGILLYSKIFLLTAICTLGVIAAVLGIALIASSGKSRQKRDALCAEYGKSFSELDGYIRQCLDALKTSRAADAERSSARIRLEEAESEGERARERLISLLERTVSVTDRSHDALRALVESEAQRIIEMCRRRRELSVRIATADGQISSLETELSPYDRDALRASVTVDADTVTEEVIENAERTDKFNRLARSEMEKKVRELRETSIMLRAGLSQSPAELADRICVLEEKLEKDTEYYDALMLAKESIEAASLSMSGNVTPEISRVAGELLALVSGGAHTSVQTDKSLALSVEDGGFLVSSETLSGGTRDAAYIALRVSLMLRLFGEELPVLMLDETLCQLDDGRARGVLSVLAALPQRPQCLVFTCHTRESVLCREEGIAFSETVL